MIAAEHTGALKDARRRCRRESSLGHEQKSNSALPSSALTSTADIKHQGCEVRKVPISEVNDPFDHLVGERCRGNGNAERFRGFEIDHEGKLARLLDRAIAGPGGQQGGATFGSKHTNSSEQVS
jgi:hypothetical protein